MQAICIDDGYGGTLGVIQDSAEHKVLQWIDSMSSLYPSVATIMNKPLVHTYCNALITVGDIVQTSDHTLRCTAPHSENITPTLRTTLGFADPTANRDDCAIVSGSLFLYDTHYNSTIPITEQYELRSIPPNLQISIIGICLTLGSCCAAGHCKWMGSRY